MSDAEKKLRKKILKVVKDNEVVSMAYSSFDSESVDYALDDLVEELHKLFSKQK